MTEAYAVVGRASFKDHADDLVTFRQKPHPEYPSLPCWTAIVSRSDIEAQRTLGKSQIPKRAPHGELLSAIHARLPIGLADAFAKANGWPFTIHINNLDGAEEVKGEL